MKPAIRFAGFSEDWERRKLGDTLSSLQNNTLSRAELSSENGIAKNVHYGDVLIKFGEYLDVSKERLPMIADDTVVAKYKSSFLRNGDVIIADTAEDETVGKCSEIGGLQDEIVISGLHTIPYRPQIDFAFGFLGYYMNSSVYHSQLLPLMQGIKVTSVSKSAMQDTVIRYPNDTDEQAQISACFRNLDTLITLHQRKYNKLVCIKKAMLEKMFPKKGSCVPEIRFAGFTVAWERIKLGDLVDIGDIDHRMPPTTSDGIPYLMTGDFCGINEFNFSNAKLISAEDYKQLSKKIKPEKEDIVFARYASVGAVRYVDFDKDFLVSYSCAIIKSGEKIIPKYLYHFITSDDAQTQIQIEINTGSQANIGIESMKSNIIVSMPNEAEQSSIAGFLTTLDRLITLEQRALEKLKTLKKAFLEKMFV